MLLEVLQFTAGGVWERKLVATKNVYLATSTPFFGQV
jgi:hypothetical protein